MRKIRSFFQKLKKHELIEIEDIANLKFDIDNILNSIEKTTREKEIFLSSLQKKVKRILEKEDREDINIHLEALIELVAIDLKGQIIEEEQNNFITKQLSKIKFLSNGNNLKNQLKKFKYSMKTSSNIELEETIDLFKTMVKKDKTEEDYKEMKQQIKDLGKIVVVLSLPNVLIPAVQHTIKKINEEYTLFPTGFGSSAKKIDYIVKELEKIEKKWDTYINNKETQNIKKAINLVFNYNALLENIQSHIPEKEFKEIFPENEIISSDTIKNKIDKIEAFFEEQNAPKQEIKQIENLMSR